VGALLGLSLEKVGSVVGEPDGSTGGPVGSVVTISVGVVDGIMFPQMQLHAVGQDTNTGSSQSTAIVPISQKLSVITPVVESILLRKELYCKFNSSIDERSPISVGIVPEMLLICKSIRSKENKSPILGEIVPTNPLSDKLI